MEIRQVIAMSVGREGIDGEIEWERTKEANLGSIKHPNQHIKVIKLYPDVEIKL